jgi:hypothetical protein
MARHCREPGSFLDALIRPPFTSPPPDPKNPKAPDSGGWLADWLAHAGIDIWLFGHAWTGPRDPPRAPRSENFLMNDS